MKTLKATRLTLSLLGLAIAGAVAAQQPSTDFPTERTKPASCDDFKWNVDMTREHPRVIDACQEAVTADGSTWARLAARFVRVQSDGQVVFSVRDKNDRVIEQVTMEPAPGQVAYIDDRATEFNRLSTTDNINLYVPEGEYGYATQPVAKARFARVLPVVAATAPSAESAPAAPPVRAVAMASEQPLPSRLPATASLLPWLAFTGVLLMFGGLTMRLRRKL